MCRRRHVRAGRRVVFRCINVANVTIKPKLRSYSKMYINKKILAAAVAGALMVGGTATAAQLDVVTQYYANEIVVTAAAPLVPSTAPNVTWKSGYNYSVGEV